MGFILSLTFGSVLCSLGNFLWTHFLPFLFWLFSLQAVLQMLQAGIKLYWLKYIVLSKSASSKTTSESSSTDASNTNSSSTTTNAKQKQPDSATLKGKKAGDSQASGNNGNDAPIPSAAEERVSAGIPFIRSMGTLLGLTGDNSPKKRIIEHESNISFILPFVALVIHFYRYLAEPLEWWPHSMMLLVAVLLSALISWAMKFVGVFFLFKNYSEAGCGVNLYLHGWRVLGLDYHAWTVRQHPETGKPLNPEDQYESPARFHLDIPPLNLHHWPYEQHPDCETTNFLLGQKAEMRAEKRRNKELKRERRAQQIAEKELRRANPELAALEAVKADEDAVLNDDFFS